MFCPNCGMQVSENAQSCANCKHVFTQTVQQPVQQPVQNPIASEFVNTNMQTQLIQNDIKKPSFLKNKIIIIIIGLVVLVGAIFGISYFLNGNLSKEAKEIASYFDPNKPIRIKENGLYGYIDTNGKTIINPQYKNAQQFDEKYALVQLPADESGNEYFSFIDKKGNVVLKTTLTYGSGIKYISEDEVWLIDNKLYNKNLTPITEEGTRVDTVGNGYYSFMETNSVGIMNAKGKATYSMKTNGESLYFAADTEDIEFEDLKEIYCQTNIDNERYGIVNCQTGKIIVDYSTKYISADDNNIFQISNKDTYEFYEKIYVYNNKIAYKTTNQDDRLEYIGNNILEIGNSWPYKYFDVKNNKSLDQKPNLSDIDLEEALEKIQGFKQVSCAEGGYGIMKDDKYIVPCGWDRITYIDDPLYSYAESKGKQLVFVRKNSKISLYDMKANKVITNFNSSSISGDYGDSIFIYYKDDDTKRTVVYNVINGKQKDFDENISISNESNYFTVKKDNKLEYYNTDFKLIYTGSVN